MADAGPVRRAVLMAAVLVLMPLATSDHAETADGKTVTFQHKTGNEWWVEVILSGPDAGTLTGVEATDGGVWVPLDLRSWGAWAASFHIEPGNEVRFRALWGDGSVIESCAFSHPGGVEQCDVPPVPGGVSIEAEDFAVKTTGGRTPGGSASGGAYWNLWSNGHIQDAFTAEVQSDLVVHARGTPAAGQWPIMEVRVDGELVGTRTVDADSFMLYVFPGIAPGDHTVRVAFTNDRLTSTEDRNLHVDLVRLVEPGAEEPPPVGESELIAEGLDFPVDLAFGPDGTLYYAELASGDIRQIPPGSDAPSPGALGHVDAVPGGNGGFLGLLLDRDFSNTSAFYVYYSAQKADGSMENRVSRMVDGVETIIVDGIPYGHEHDGGRLAWMGEHLLVTTGEAQDFSIPMDPDSLGGKTLRITPDGDPAPGNPTPGSPVYSLGHRNPFGIAYDPEAGIIWQTENGPHFGDEINIIEPGGNYGWPAVAGIAGDPRYVDPVIEVTPTIGPTGGTVLNGTFYFGSFNDASVYRVDGGPGDYSASRIWSIESWRRILDVEAGPDGALYASSYHEIYRLPVDGGAPPSDLPPLVPSAREAEDFASKTTGREFSDGSASGGAIWNLWANGHIQDQLQSDGTHPLVVMAAGDPALGIWPHAKVFIDGDLVWEFDATSTAIKAYEGPVPCEGIHTVRIEFTNDYYAPPEDRNWRLDQVFFGDAGGGEHGHPPEGLCA